MKHMKHTTTLRLSVVASAVAACLVLAPGAAGAATFEQLLQNAGEATSDQSYENINTGQWGWNGNSDSDTLVEVGDDLAGIAQWNTLDNASGSNSLVQPLNSYVATVFDAQVYWRGDLTQVSTPPPDPLDPVGTNGNEVSTGTTTLPAGSGNTSDTYDYIFEPNPNFADYWETALSLPAGTLDGAMVLFFEDAQVDDNLTEAQAVSEVTTNGNLVLALGMGQDGSANGWGTDATGDERWVATGAAEDISILENISSGQQAGNFNSSLSVVYNAMDVQFNQVQSDLATVLGELPEGDGDIDWNLSGGIKGTSDVSDTYQAADNTDGTFASTSTSVPEPSILALMGIGLLGARVSARRRRVA